MCSMLNVNLKRDLKTYLNILDKSEIVRILTSIGLDKKEIKKLNKIK